MPRSRRQPKADQRPRIAIGSVTLTDDVLCHALCRGVFFYALATGNALPFPLVEELVAHQLASLRAAAGGAAKPPIAGSSESTPWWLRD